MNVHQVLLEILKHSPPGKTSALSLRRKETLADLEGFDWSRITFTRRLVELQLADTKLHDDSEIISFLAALSSAQELKELRLVSFVIALDRADATSADPSRVISLPKLEHLHLEHLYFNVLQYVLSFIAPGSHRLTLNPLEETFFNYSRYGTGENRVDDERIFTFFSDIKVHKLLLWGQRRFFWSTKASLTRVLQSLPMVKTLVLSYYPTNTDTLAALKRPLEAIEQKNRFPILTSLEIHGAYVENPLVQLKSVPDEVTESHEIQHLVFRGVFVLDEQVPITEPLDDSDVFEWLKHKVPYFTKSCESHKSPEATDMWRLWDAHMYDAYFRWYLF